MRSQALQRGDAIAPSSPQQLEDQRQHELHCKACAQVAALSAYRQQYGDESFIPLPTMTWDQIDHWTLLRYRLRDYVRAADAVPFRKDEFDKARRLYEEIAHQVFTDPNLHKCVYPQAWP